VRDDLGTGCERRHLAIADVSQTAAAETLARLGDLRPIDQVVSRLAL